MGTFTTNELGQILLTGVDGGETLYLKEIQTLPGYQLDETVHEVTLAWGQQSTVELLNRSRTAMPNTALESYMPLGWDVNRITAKRQNGLELRQIVDICMLSIPSLVSCIEARE